MRHSLGCARRRNHTNTNEGEMNDTKTIHWDGGVQQEGLDILLGDGGMIVSPTKVGYIIMTSDGQGLERKFEAKQRNRNKPGVVLCGSMEQLKALARMTPEIEAYYQQHWDEDILMGCILPWRDDAAERFLVDEHERELARDRRGTSCFVIRFGTPGEQIAAELWKHGRLAFASSANPSGKGNRGRVEGIGERIASRADLIVEADDYVHSIQPNETEETRYEQGVMVSMVDADGNLVPEQHGERSITPCPVLIRRGVYLDRILQILAQHFNSWDYRQGQYY
jgi:tRNA A37 threonylcarbamoyladenosine synthetase subunit TsaC/SUA5/YrdC